MRVLAAIAVLLCLAPASWCAEAVPDWVRELARQQLPASTSKAVILLDENTLSIRDSGEMYARTRRVVKILQAAGRSQATHTVWTDGETRIASMHAWSISPEGKEYALKDREIQEGAPASDLLFEDSKYRTMSLAQSDPGTIVAFEYEQRLRPYVHQQIWWFQDDIPVQRAVYNLILPDGWEFNHRWLNWKEAAPVQTAKNSWRWEVADVPAFQYERAMPAMQGLIGRVVLSFYSPSLNAPGKRMSSWADVSEWANSLNEERRNSSPDIKQKVAELTAGKAAWMDQLRAVGYFVQHDIRYVGIEIGIGGFQAHSADATFRNRYGDCKDKATLAASMLREIGLESYLLLVNTRRGSVAADAPSYEMFNHAVLAVKIPAGRETPGAFAVLEDPAFGKLLIFDPTDEFTPVGLLRPALQDTYALLVAHDNGHLLRTPLLSPVLSRLLRVGNLEVAPDGSLTGEIQEIRTGYQATAMRSELLQTQAEKRAAIFEQLLAESLPTARLLSASVDNLNRFDDSLVLHYRFSAGEYATAAGDLLLVRPRVLDQKALDLAENAKRKYPVVLYGGTSSESDVYNIKLPPGFAVDELPKTTSVKYPFAEYSSTIEAKDNILKYSRSFTVKDVMVPVSQMADLRAFMREVAQDEQSAAVLKKAEVK